MHNLHLMTALFMIIAPPPGYAGGSRELLAWGQKKPHFMDYMSDQLTLFEEFDPFTGKKNKKK